MSDIESGVSPAPPTPGSATAGPYTPRLPVPPAEPRQLGWRFWVAVVVGAVVVDLAARRPPWNNVAASVAIVAMAGVLLASGRLRSTSSRVAIVLAAVLGSFLWFRTDPVLVTFDLLGVLALGWYGVIHSRGATMWDTGPVRLIVRIVETLVLVFETVFDSGAEIAARHRRAQESSGTVNEVGAAVARGAVIAIPVLVVLGLLLASADAVFASFFDVGVGLDVPSLVGHGILLALGAGAMILFLRLAGRDLASPMDQTDGFQLGRIEAMVVLIGLDALFAAFAAAQVVALTGGADRALESAGLTFKEYARQGFFQLLWVAAITLVVLVTLNTLTRHLGSVQRRPVVGASLLAVLLTLLIVFVAFGRLRLYFGDDGLTPLRFYSTVFSAWIGVVFLLLAVRVLGRWPARSWLTTAIGLSGLVFLIGLNVANPERIIADNNLHRDAPGILYHMEKLSADGQVVLFDGLDRLSPELRAEVGEKLCARAGYDEFGFDRTGLGFNLSEHRLDERQAANCNG